MSFVQPYFAGRLRPGLLERFGPKADLIYGKTKNIIFSCLKGTILEIGPGVGGNFHYLPANVHWIGVEPNTYMHPYLKQSLDRRRIDGEILTALAENIPVGTDSVDFVISTLVLCSVSDPAKVLEEIRRILKPGGKFIFIEHVASQEGALVRSLQRLIRPIFEILGDGCKPDRNLGRMIDTAGFNRVNYDYHVLKEAFILTRRHIIGFAVK